MKLEWRRLLWPNFLMTGLRTGLVCVLTACPRRTAANLSNHPDRLLLERAMAAASSGKFDVANLSLQILINTWPNSKYATQAKIALQDPRIAQCGAGWNSVSPACAGSPVAGTPTEASSRMDRCVISQFSLALGIQPGMTRSDLLEVFTMEGGLSNRLRQTYVLKGCEIIHVDVTYSPISNETDHLTEMPGDKIDTISKPYLDAFHAD
jgi:hypothetical protein